MADFSQLITHDMSSSLREIARELIKLARDLRWTWSHGGDALWELVDPVTWDVTRNPYAVLQNLSRERLAELDSNPAFKDELDQVVNARKEYLERSSWWDDHVPSDGVPRIAYFSMEFGLGAGLPLYAGGLGVLAGDHLKAASDLGVPVVGIGLLYQQGYFRQMLDIDGSQLELYAYNDSRNLPVRPVYTKSGSWLSVSLQLPGRPVRLRVWRALVGRVVLYLLDSNDPMNTPYDRGITSQLYGGSTEVRLMQEIALGIGGWRVVEALGLPVKVCHLNEGHAAFASIERARCLQEKEGYEFWDALWVTRAGNVFTTHTPIAAAFDSYPAELLAKYGTEYAAALGMEPQTLLALGRSNPDDREAPFNMAFLACRTCARINGVSRLHGEVSRSLFRGLYPRWPLDEVPITHITNGVHVPSWDSRWADKIWTASCGKARWLGSVDAMGRAIERLTDSELWSLRGQERNDLVTYARSRVARQLGQRGAAAGVINVAKRALDPNALTLGFARRFTEYKRPNLLLYDPERLARLLGNAEKPVQIIVAGKAHPKDQAGKAFIRSWSEFVRRPEVRERAVFLEDYDMALAQELVQGVDVWINTPRRPWEACGTSGMKVLVNGGINVSELDGWWAEAYSPDVGWALGHSRAQEQREEDAADAEALYRLLEGEVVPEFYDRDASGVPRAWVQRIRNSMAMLTSQFSSNRMLQEYTEQIYLPAAAEFDRRSADNASIARQLRSWRSTLAAHWQNVHWGNLEVTVKDDIVLFEVQLYLGEVPPDFVRVDLYAEPLKDSVPVCEPMVRREAIPGALNGFVYKAKLQTERPLTEFTPRVSAFCAHAHVPSEANMISWWSGLPTVYEQHDVARADFEHQ